MWECINQILYMVGISLFIGSIIISFFKEIKSVHLMVTIVLPLAAAGMTPTMWEIDPLMTVIWLALVAIMEGINIYDYYKRRAGK